MKSEKHRKSLKTILKFGKSSRINYFRTNFFKNMKNKHLVLLFLGIVIVGWFGRKFHFGNGTDLRIKLCKSEMKKLYKILVINIDTIELIKNEEEWIAGINDDNILFPDSLARSVLETITNMESMYFIKTDLPDTLGFTGKDAIGIHCFSDNIPREESFTLGKCVIFNGAPSTWVAIKGHEQYYLAKGDLKAPLQIKWANLKPIKRFLTDTIGIKAVVVWFEKDTTQFTSINNLAADSMKIWLNGFYQMTISAPEADFFDVEHEDHSRIGEVHLQKEDHLPAQVYHFYYAARPTLPDDPEKMKRFKNYQPQYVIAAQKNPNVFYALKDTFLVRQIMTGH